MRSGGQWRMAWRDTGWLTITLTGAGWDVPSGYTPQVRQVGDDVKFRGAVRNITFTGGFTTVASLPAGIAAPQGSTRVEALGGNTPTPRSVQYTTAGLIQMYTSAASSAYYFLGPGYRV